MRFLIVTPDYPTFSRHLYSTNPDLATMSYEEQMKVRLDSAFLWADFYAQNLTKLGHEAWEIYPNVEPMQRAWSREQGIASGSTRDVLRQQIASFNPDVLFVRDISVLDAYFLSTVRADIHLIIGQHASPWDWQRPLGPFDLIVSSLPNYVANFRSKGVRSELLRLGFEATLLQRSWSPYRDIPVSFVGTIGEDHVERKLFLEHLCTRCQLEIWGTRLGGIGPASPIYRCYRGPAYGRQMYDIFARSLIVINHHETWVAQSYANNMRLFEATGMGALLLTDTKQDLNKLFKVGREVVTYKSVEDCVDMINLYLASDHRRDAIAVAGQERTLQEHTYMHRMQELLAIINKL